jgi:hypothetical protein
MSDRITSSLAAALAALALGAATQVLAHHGWSSFDETKPLYLAGTAESVRWENPHAIVRLRPAAGLSLPTDLATREAPPQQAPIDGARVLAEARLPDTLDAEWEIELAPLTRMAAWDVPVLSDGDAIEVVGYTFPDQRGNRVMRAEYLIVGDRIFGLRSAPR